MYLFCFCGVQTDSRCVYNFFTFIFNLFILNYLSLFYLSLFFLFLRTAYTHTNELLVYAIFPPWNLRFRFFPTSTCSLPLTPCVLSFCLSSPSYSYFYIPSPLPLSSLSIPLTSHPLLYFSSSLASFPVLSPAKIFSCVSFVSSDPSSSLYHHHRTCSHHSSSHSHTLHNTFTYSHILCLFFI